MRPAAAPTRKARDSPKPGIWPYSATTGMRIAEHDGYLGELVGALIGLRLAVVPIDLAL
jgi:hypothetical protein